MNSRQQTTVLASGIIVEWLLVCLGVLGAEWVYASGTIHEILNNLAIGATVRFLLNANPFGKLDGAFLLSVWTRTPDLRRRATAWFRSWIVRQPPTEPLTPRQARMFLVYGALADATTILIDLLLIWLLGYLLVGRLAGPGAVLFLTFVILKYERTLRRWATATRSLLTGQATADQQRRARTIGLALGGLGLCLCAIPYPFKVTGPLRVQPAVKHHVRAAVEAPIDAILVAEGSPVQKGQVMARLSEREIRHNLDKVRAALERESEQLRMLQNGARPEEIDQAEQQIRLAEVSLRHSSNALSRLQPLYRNQQVSDSEFDRAIRQRDLDLEQRELAVRELALVKAGTRPEQIEAKRAEVERVRAQFTHLEWQLEQTRIAAPIAGRVTSLFVQEKTGQHLKVGDVVAVVEDPRTALLRVGIPECYAALLKEGAPVQAKVRGFPNRTFAGTVRSISPIVVEQQEDRTRQASAEQDPTVLRSLDSPPVHVIPILVEVPNEDGVLKTDMTGYAKVRVRNTSVAYALVHPVIDFVRVQVWSWVP
jgi:multidrug resistance efflux pump